MRLLFSRSNASGPIENLYRLAALLADFASWTASPGVPEPCRDPVDGHEERGLRLASLSVVSPLRRSST
jgi:hypothetical protein